MQKGKDEEVPGRNEESDREPRSQIHSNPKEENECANRLAKTASAKFMIVSKQVLSFVQVSSLIDNRMNV